MHSGHVSIHARPCGTGARRGYTGQVWCQTVSIHARPCGTGAHDCISRYVATGWFQSTPALVGRALVVRRAGHLHVRRFNPRPPLWDGRSCSFFRRSSSTLVSIHARPCGTGARPLNVGSRDVTLVSIHARPCGTGARKRTSVELSCRCNLCFNPRPPLWDGRSAKAEELNGANQCFNPRPPLWDGRSQIYSYQP